MAQRIGDERVAHVGSYRLYIRPDGKLVLPIGNVKMLISPEEARELLDFLLLFASRFTQTDEPVTGGLAHANGMYHER